MDPLLLSVGKLLAEGAVNEVGGKIVDRFLTDVGMQRPFKDIVGDAIESAVARICSFVYEVVSRDRFRAAVADLTDSANKLSLYVAAGGVTNPQDDRLTDATSLSSNAAAHLLSLGLAGWEAYPIAVGVQLAAQHERVLRYGQHEKQATRKLIGEIAIPAMNSLRDQWIETIEKSGRLYHYGGTPGPPFREDQVILLGFPKKIDEFVPGGTGKAQLQLRLEESRALLNMGPFRRQEDLIRDWRIVQAKCATNATEEEEDKRNAALESYGIPVLFQKGGGWTLSSSLSRGPIEAVREFSLDRSQSNEMTWVKGIGADPLRLFHNDQVLLKTRSGFYWNETKGRVVAIRACSLDPVASDELFRIRRVDGLNKSIESNDLVYLVSRNKRFIHCFNRKGPVIATTAFPHPHDPFLLEFAAFRVVFA